jgi:predicted ABC-type transport system involved in lysophospholipase L1 biosynthesis ATPase subunit
VLENLEVPLFYQGRVGPESRKKAEYLAERVGLGKRLEHRPLRVRADSAADKQLGRRSEDEHRRWGRLRC